MSEATKDAATTDEFLPSWQQVKNVDSIDCPAFGVVEVTGIDATTGMITVRRPTAVSLPNVMIVSQSPIAAGGEGLASFAAPLAALCDPADGTPTAGTTWGTKVNSFMLGATNQGFIALVSISTGLAVFKYATTTGSGDIVRIIRFESPSSTDSTGKCLSGYTQKFLTIDPTDDELVWARLV